MTGFQMDVIASFVDAGVIKAHGNGWPAQILASGHRQLNHG